MCVYEPAALSLRWPDLLLRALDLNGTTEELLLVGLWDSSGVGGLVGLSD